MASLIFLGSAVVVLVSAALSWSFRRLILAVAPERYGGLFRSLPLSACFGIMIVAGYLIVAIFAPIVAPYPEDVVVGSEYLPWSREFILGTDNLGRDMFSRLVFGARNTMGIAVMTTVLSFGVGALLGLIASTVGGMLDTLTSRLVDVLMAIPSLIFALLLLSVLGTSVINMVLVIAALDSTRVYRLTRAVSMNIVVMDYIESARLRGEGIWRLITREILPNAAAPLMAEFGLRFCFVFLSISALSFLGLGIQPPTADWGSMVRDNAALITFGDVTPLLPAGAIAFLTIAVNFIVDWMLHRSSGLKE
jgi:peptide/nickel transport system permease protein